MRTTEFWNRMRAQFGDVYAQSLAKDYVFASLGDRTVERALAEGADVKVVWRAVADAFNVPENQRLTAENQNQGHYSERTVGFPPGGV